MNLSRNKKGVSGREQIALGFFPIQLILQRPNQLDYTALYFGYMDWKLIKVHLLVEEPNPTPPPPSWKYRFGVLLWTDIYICYITYQSNGNATLKTALIVDMSQDQGLGELHIIYCVFCILKIKPSSPYWSFIANIDYYGMFLWYFIKWYLYYISLFWTGTCWYRSHLRTSRVSDKLFLVYFFHYGGCPTYINAEESIVKIRGVQVKLFYGFHCKKVCPVS